jgi:hypothetical protein
VKTSSDNNSVKKVADRKLKSEESDAMLFMLEAANALFEEADRQEADSSWLRDSRLEPRTKRS